MPEKIKHIFTTEGFSGLWQMVRTALKREDEALALRCQALGGLAEGTLGRAFYDHHERNGFPLPGMKGGFPSSMAFHDLGHILSGYGADSHGELLTASFQAGYLDQDPMVMYLMIASMFQLGIEYIADKRGVEASTGIIDVKAFRIAYLRGKAMKVNLLKWDPWPHVHRTLEDVRNALGVVSEEAIVAQG